MVLNVHTLEEKRQTAVCMYSGNHHTPWLCLLQEAPPHTAAMMVDKAIGCWVGGPVTVNAQPAAARRQCEAKTPIHSLGT